MEQIAGKLSVSTELCLWFCNRCRCGEVCNKEGCPGLIRVLLGWAAGLGCLCSCCCGGKLCGYGLLPKSVACSD